MNGQPLGHLIVAGRLLMSSAGSGALGALRYGREGLDVERRYTL